MTIDPWEPEIIGNGIPMVRYDRVRPLYDQAIAERDAAREDAERFVAELDNVLILLGSEPAENPALVAHRAATDPVHDPSSTEAWEHEDVAEWDRR